MKSSALAAASLAALLAVLAFSLPARSAPPQGGKVGSAMEELGGAVKSLQEKLKAGGELEGALADVWKAQHAAIDAKSELPKSVSDIADEKARHKAALAYRAQLQELVRAFLDVETALLNGDAKKADKALRAADNLKSAGHGQFRKEGPR